jgi:hypothetical protein
VQKLCRIEKLSSFFQSIYPSFDRIFLILHWKFLIAACWDRDKQLASKETKYAKQIGKIITVNQGEPITIKGEGLNILVEK